MISAKDLLNRTRLLNTAVQSQAGGQIRFSDLVAALGRSLDAQVALLSHKSKVLAATDDTANTGALLDEKTHQALVSMSETTTVNDLELVGEHEGAAFTRTVSLAVVLPIYGGGERLGTLLVDKELDDADLILAEYATTVAGVELLRAHQDEMVEETRMNMAARLAASALSYSETEALEQVFADLGGTEGLVVASKIADRAGVTRSVIVNGLRKLESAGVITSRSLGMKGTFIKVLNPSFLEELHKLA